MHYLRAGSGAPPLVFVHGFGCSHEDWGLQVDFFRRTNEVVACDLRGHGLTPGRPDECSIEHYGGDVAALLNNLDLSTAVLIGHSMGCRVVLEAARVIAAAENPERVGGLVLIDGSRTGTGDPEAAEKAAAAMIEKTGYAAFAENLFRQMFFAPSALGEAVVARGLRQTAEIGPALWARMARWDAQVENALAAVRVPVLVIQSTTRDPKTVKRAPLQPGERSPWLDLLRENLNDLKMEIIPRVGHFTMLEAATAVNRLLGAFAAERRSPT
jgi:pimeloyl-ACP methyl ester carboxylesterase